MCEINAHVFYDCYESSPHAAAEFSLCVCVRLPVLVYEFAWVLVDAGYACFDSCDQCDESKY